MLRIFQSPETFSFGMEDRFSDKMIMSLRRCGIDCEAKRLWPEFWARRLFFSKLPYTAAIYGELIAPFCCAMHLLKIRGDDVVWINGTSMPITDTECWFEKQVIRRGASYVFWLEDDYFSKTILKASGEARMALAHLVVVVTPALRERVSKLYPDKAVILLEEPIDVERLTPRDPLGAQKAPIVLWSGRPWGIRDLVMLDGVLKRVYRDIPFTLRVITGSKKPDIDLSIPWEWVSYDRSKEAEYAAGAVCGLAPLEETAFNLCKGNYKVKTYMALGLVPLAPPIGYNKYLVRHDQTGFLLSSEEEWELALRELLKDRSKALEIGIKAREDMIKRYSYDALMPVWAKALREAFPVKLT